MPETNSWKEYFDSHAPRYMQNPFTYSTLREIDFLVEELALPKGSRILDIGCGTGRHSIELAKRGYIMTGVDI
ncbi:MAG: methyltransferase domain-containing protein, partial [Dehalococcoidales bacterium]